MHERIRVAMDQLPARVGARRKTHVTSSDLLVGEASDRAALALDDDEDRHGHTPSSEQGRLALKCIKHESRP